MSNTKSFPIIDGTTLRELVLLAGHLSEQGVSLGDVVVDLEEMELTWDKGGVPTPPDIKAASGYVYHFERSVPQDEFVVGANVAKMFYSIPEGVPPESVLYSDDSESIRWTETRTDLFKRFEGYQRAVALFARGRVTDTVRKVHMQIEYLERVLSAPGGTQVPSMEFGMIAYVEDPSTHNRPRVPNHVI